MAALDGRVPMLHVKFKKCQFSMSLSLRNAYHASCRFEEMGMLCTCNQDSMLHVKFKKSPCCHIESSVPD